VSSVSDRAMRETDVVLNDRHLVDHRTAGQLLLVTGEVSHPLGYHQRGQIPSPQQLLFGDKLRARVSRMRETAR
tara:strand:- start:96 stop:317 length:222 start_codon:yes stop_codon:yes gene_type:complete